jgi:hypothetical protein
MSAEGRVGNPPRLLGHEQAMEVDDSILWSRARTGDSEAFGMLFDRHARTIYRRRVARTRGIAPGMVEPNQEKAGGLCA